LVGTSTNTNVASSVGALVQTRFAGSFTNFAAIRESGPAAIVVGRANGSAAQIVANNDILGEIRFAGADGVDLETQAAVIKAEVDGTPGANDMPGRLVFSTTSDGASSPTERLRIDSSGRVGIGTSSPTHKLHVAADLVNLKLAELAAGSENSLSLGNSAGLYWTHDDRTTVGLELSTHRSIPNTYPISLKNAKLYSIIY
jgi:hypothetical protein